jgi:hypothetical protein
MLRATIAKKNRPITFFLSNTFEVFSHSFHDHKLAAIFCSESFLVTASP